MDVRRICVFGLVLLLGWHLAIGQSYGKVDEKMSMRVGILPYDINYTIYLPPDYELSKRYYPVVYLLHGFSDDQTGWVQFGEMKQIVDNAIVQGTIAPITGVMPYAKKNWYVNNFRGNVRYMDMLFQEFIPFIDRTCRTRPEKEFRGIAGLSVGG